MIKPFRYAGFLDVLERSGDITADTQAAMSPALAGLLVSAAAPAAWSPAAALLIPVLKARRATWQAAADTELAADELRKYQKYAKPGRPSPHIVQLRQKQAAARQATSIARQALIKAAAAFVREADIDVPERMPLDTFIVEWIDTHVPKDAATSA
ncbi:hypothetical protein [Dyella sp. C11]|uniref:hypothetical protein n=1 Tax=Dyella sp. C11 TaxID=2126991 RepID=UPI000D650037|nr:hypothetical protein [Dyella sp. C11]